MSAPTAADRRRQLGVTVAEVFCIVGTLFGVGVLGTRVAESAGGALAADATLLAPAGRAFSIWSVIYLGLAAYTVWQWFPGPATRPRVRRTGWLIALSMVLNAVWLLVTQTNLIGLSVVVIAGLMFTLGVLLRRLGEDAPEGRLERVVLDGTVGLYAGWVAVAVCANVTAAAVHYGVVLPVPVGESLAVAVLVVVVVIAYLIARRSGGRLAVAAAMAWGLAWIAVGRLLTEPRSTVVGVAAIVAAAGVLLVTFVGQRRHTR